MLSSYVLKVSGIRQKSSLGLCGCCEWATLFNMRTALSAAVIAFCLTARADAQDVTVTYRDGAADRFMIESQSCPLAQTQFVIDLRTSVAGVLIDTAYGGLGSRDPLPALVVAGDATLAPVNDGDQILTLMVHQLAPQDRVVVTLDTDDSISDTEGQRVHVSGSEIAGSTVRMVVGGIGTEAAFDAQGDAHLDNPTCLALSS